MSVGCLRRQRTFHPWLSLLCCDCCAPPPQWPSVSASQQQPAPRVCQVSHTQHSLTLMTKMRAGLLLPLWLPLPSVQLLMSAPERRTISRTLEPDGPAGGWVGWHGVGAQQRPVCESVQAYCMQGCKVRKPTDGAHVCTRNRNSCQQWIVGLRTASTSVSLTDDKASSQQGDPHHHVPAGSSKHHQTLSDSTLIAEPVPCCWGPFGPSVLCVNRMLKPGCWWLIRSQQIASPAERVKHQQLALNTLSQYTMLQLKSSCTRPPAADASLRSAKPM